jgi:hypothetical protein
VSIPREYSRTALLPSYFAAPGPGAFLSIPRECSRAALLPSYSSAPGPGAFS